MRNSPIPIVFEWKESGATPGTGIMVPLAKYSRACANQFSFGEKYPLDIVEPRNMRSHAHFFASVHEIWLNLSEEWDGRFPNDDTLRYWGLVRTGFCTTSEEVYDSPSDAERSANMARRLNRYAVIERSGNIVRVSIAESQSIGRPPTGMTKRRFQESKWKVLDFIAPMANTTREEALRETAANFPPDMQEPMGTAEVQETTELAKEPVAAPTGALDQVGPAPTRDQVKTASDYVAYARAYIEAAPDLLTAQGRYDYERKWRDELRVNVNARMALQGRIDDRFPR